MKKTIVIIGATSAIAKHCANLWVQHQPIDLTLVGRDLNRLERVASDLMVRSPSCDIKTIQTNNLEPATIQALVDDIMANRSVDIVLIAHGNLPEQTDCENNLQLCYETLHVNGLSCVLYAQAFAKHMARVNHGTIALIGSVAGDRGRKSNYVYGAAKGLITRFAQGLQHRFAGTGVKIVLIKPGPTDTPMTARFKKNGMKLALVETVAKQIVAAIDAGKPVVYTPKQWQIIMTIIALLPSFIFNKLNI